MHIDGQWLFGDDGVMRPMISGEIHATDGSWEKSEFLVDTGAYRTVFSAATLAKLGLQPLVIQEGRAIQFSKIPLSLARERVRVRVVSSALRPLTPALSP